MVDRGNTQATPKKKIMAKMIHNYQDLHKKRKTSVDVSSNGNLLLS